MPWIDAAGARAQTPNKAVSVSKTIGREVVLVFMGSCVPELGSISKGDRRWRVKVI